jgi:uncharacterized membrane protein
LGFKEWSTGKKLIVVGIIVFAIGFIVAFATMFVGLKDPAGAAETEVYVDPWDVWSDNTVVLDKKEYEIWAEEGFFGGTPEVAIYDSGDNLVFEGPTGSSTESINEWVKIGKFEARSGTYQVITSLETTVLFVDGEIKVGGVLGGFCGSFLVAAIGFLILFIGVIMWFFGRKRGPAQYMPPPPGAQYQQPGYPQPGYPPRSPPPGQPPPQPPGPP